MLQGTESLFLSIQQRLLWSLFYKSQVGLTARPGELLLVNSYMEARRGWGGGRKQGPTEQGNNLLGPHHWLFGSNNHNEELYPLRILPQSFSKAFLRALALHFSL